MSLGKSKAVFIDKDGTLVPDIPYNVDPDKISLQDGALEGLGKLQKAGYLLVIISNQSGVARGYFKEEALKGVKSKLESLLAEKRCGVKWLLLLSALSKCCCKRICKRM